MSWRSSGSAYPPPNTSWRSSGSSARRPASRFDNPEYYNRLSARQAPGQWSRPSARSRDELRHSAPAWYADPSSRPQYHPRAQPDVPARTSARELPQSHARAPEPAPLPLPEPEPVAAAPAAAAPKTMPGRAPSEESLDGDLGRVKVQHNHKKLLRKDMSRISVLAMETLDELEDRMASYEQQVDVIIDQVQLPGAHAGVLKGELGQLFGNVDKLLSTQVDAVSTSELSSGKAEARSSRKALTLRAQALLDKIEEANKGPLFKNVLSG